MRFGFELVREQAIPEVGSVGQIWRHARTGAQVVSLTNDDANKVFCIGLRTPPPDSTGILHVLEHSVLQGSRKYPSKRPISALVKGSLLTYLNARAYPDKTIFPVASLNVRDLINMIDVFLDGVFFPLLTPETFSQEGWHYALESLDASLSLSGVVYNEQKGNFAMPFNLLAVESQRAIFPDTVYRHAFGGHPDEIPYLTHERVLAYHRTYYHPSNARFFWYGDDDPDERLRYLGSWLDQFDQTVVDSTIPLQPRFERPRSVIVPYFAGEGIDAGSGKSMVTLNWMLPEVGDPELMLALEILTHILIGTSASPLRNALMNSGLGNELAGLGLWTHSRQMYFSTGLGGIISADAESVEALMVNTLHEIVASGLDSELVSASINATEFGLREANWGRFPRGLVLIRDRAMNLWVHDHDPLALIAFEAPLQALKARVARGEPIFERLVHDHLTANPHRATVLLEPDPAVRPDSVMQTKLAGMKQALGQTELRSIIQQTRALRRYQQLPDDPVLLKKVPTMRLEDIDRQTAPIPIRVVEIGGCVGFYHDIPTNGILYLDLAFDLHVLPEDLLPLAHILGDALMNSGTLRRSHSQISRALALKTGGLTSEVLTAAGVDGGQPAARLVLRGKAMAPGIADLLELIRELLLEADLSRRERFGQLVREAKAGLEAALMPRGADVVARRVSAQFSPTGWYAEQLSGIDQLRFLRRLESETRDDWQRVLGRLEQARDVLVHRNALIVNVTTDAAGWEVAEPTLADFVTSLPQRPVEPSPLNNRLQKADEAFVVAAPVNFVGKGANLVELGYRVRGSIAPIVNHISSTWLWNRVREQGGAYAAACRFDRPSGMLTFTSYRDPHLAQTLATYDQTANMLRSLHLSEDDRVSCIIGAIRELDAYQLPDARGYSSMVRHLTGDSDARRQAYRAELLETTEADFRDFAEIMQLAIEQGNVVVMGSQESIDEANAGRGDWLTVRSTF